MFFRRLNESSSSSLINHPHQVTTVVKQYIFYLKNLLSLYQHFSLGFRSTRTSSKKTVTIFILPIKSTRIQTKTPMKYIFTAYWIAYYDSKVPKP